MGLLAAVHLHWISAAAVSSTTIYVLAVIFVATLIRSAIGFGEALFAVPLLALRLPLEIAAPLAVLLSITIALIVVVQDWRKVHARSMGWLIFATIFGIPLGLALLTSSHQSLVKTVLALLLLDLRSIRWPAAVRRNSRPTACPGCSAADFSREYWAARMA